MLSDITLAQQRARARLDRRSTRRRRSDAGRSRLPAPILDELRSATRGHGRPSMASLVRRVTERCTAEGLEPPARSSLYNALSRLEGQRYDISALPPTVVQALYNLAPTARVPGHHLAFYCLNYGSLTALSFAAGLPWLDLYLARRLRGWRPRSRGLLTAILRARGIQ